MKDNKTELEKLEKKLINKPDFQTFVNDVHDMNLDQLKQQYTRLGLEREGVVTAKNEDEELQRISEHKKEVEAPYREQITKTKLMERFVALKIKDRT